MPTDTAPPDAGRLIGTAGWSIAAREADAFPGEGTSLERYSARFACAEINSSFHRSHRAETWERWAASVPAGFRFSVKLSKVITHEQRLVGCEALLDGFLAEAARLGTKLAVILVQLPPSLAFDRLIAAAFFSALRDRSPSRIAFEPRHASWFEEEADQLLEAQEVARVAADPARVPAAATPGGWRGLSYYRLHGSPVAYRSSYDDGRLEAYAAQLQEDTAETIWCIFDNTASSAATGDALKLRALLGA